MIHQKEQNKQHPVYRLFSTRTNTHHQRGKISDELRRDVLQVAEEYWDRVLMDNDYAANGYTQDMEQKHVYEEARKRLE